MAFNSQSIESLDVFPFLDIANEYTSNKNEFDKKALAMTKKHGLPRS